MVEQEEFLWPGAFLKLIEEASSLPLLSPEKMEFPEKFKVQPSNLEGRLICGVDGSHVGKELSGHYLGVVVAMAYTSGPKEIHDEEPLFDGRVCRFTSVSGDLWLSLLDARYVFRVARLAVERRRPDWILIDGPLLLYPALRYHHDEGLDLGTLEGYSDALRNCVAEILDFLERCRERVPVLGLVKRVRSSLYDPTRTRRDSALLQRYLAYGEATEPRKPFREGGSHPSLELYQKYAKERGMEADWDEFFKVMYVRTSKVKPPVRLEIPYWVDPREAAGLVLSISDPISGIPAHILRVEGLIRMGEGILKSVYMRLFTRAARECPEYIQDLVPFHGEEFLEERWEGG